MSCWPVTLMISQATGNYKGVRLASEQELYSHKLILASSFVFQLPPPHSSPGAQQNVYCDFGSKNTTEKLARSICITKHSLKLDKANCLAFFPPRCKICITCLLFLSDFNISNFLPYQFFSPALFPEQVTAIHVLQLSSNVAVCPSGMWVHLPNFYLVTTILVL